MLGAKQGKRFFQGEGARAEQERQLGLEWAATHPITLHADGSEQRATEVHNHGREGGVVSVEVGTCRISGSSKVGVCMLGKFQEM